MSEKRVCDCLLEPVTSDSSILSLRNLVNLLKSSIGPNGKAKILVTSGNYIHLTSCSGTFADRLDIQNPICRYILQAMKAQPDFGLFIGTFISSLLEQIWEIQRKDQLSTDCIVKAITKIMDICSNVFAFEYYALKIDFNSVEDLLNIVKNVISCKSILYLSEKYLQQLSFNVVKSFLMSIDDSYSTINRIFVKAELGSSESSCYNGVLYQILDKEEKVTFHEISKLKSNLDSYHVLLFSVMLTYSEKNEDSFPLKCVLQFLQSAIECGIHIIACQKVVHDSIKFFLRRKNVLLLERMGTEQINALKKISDAFVISDLSKIEKLCIENIKGYLECIDIIKFNKKNFLLLQSNKRSLTTLAISTSSLATENEVKVVVEQALETLRSIAKDARLIPGAGCFDVWLLLHLQMQQASEEFNNKVDRAISKAFQKSIILASGLQLPLLYDTLYNHAWTSDNLDLDKCNCGLVTKNYIKNNNGKWISLSQNDLTRGSYGPCGVLNLNWSNLSMSNGVIMDSFLLKQNALISALEVCLNLLSVGLIVYK